MTFDTPFGPAWAVCTESGAIVRFGFGSGNTPESPGSNPELPRQLAEYFAGRRAVFELPLQPAGTEFQWRVWDELLRIPAGSHITYTELAGRAGGPGPRVRRDAPTPPIRLPC